MAAPELDAASRVSPTPLQDEQSLEKIMAIVSERVPVRNSAATSADKFINGLGGGGGGGRDGPSVRDAGRRSRDTGGYDAEERKVGAPPPLEAAIMLSQSVQHLGPVTLWPGHACCASVHCRRHSIDVPQEATPCASLTGFCFWYFLGGAN